MTNQYNEDGAPSDGEYEVEQTRYKAAIIDHKRGFTTVYLQSGTCVPLCRISDHATSWVAQYVIAYFIAALSLEGVKASVIRKRVKGEIYKYNNDHLRLRVYKRTINSAIKQTMTRQKEGTNYRASDFVAEDERIVSLRLPHTKKKIAIIAMDGPVVPEVDDVAKR